jgi:hypothetical protein
MHTTSTLWSILVKLVTYRKQIWQTSENMDHQLTRRLKYIFVLYLSTCRIVCDREGERQFGLTVFTLPAFATLLSIQRLPSAQYLITVHISKPNCLACHSSRDTLASVTPAGRATHSQHGLQTNTPSPLFSRKLLKWFIEWRHCGGL